MSDYYFSPQIINDLFSKMNFSKDEIGYDGKDKNILKRLELLCHCEIKKDNRVLIIIDPDNEKELVKKLRLMPYDSYLCSFEKLKFLESKSRYEKIFGKQQPEQVLIYSHRVEQFRDEQLYNKINNSIAYCWVVWYRDEKGFFSKETKLDWIY